MLGCAVTPAAAEAAAPAPSSSSTTSSTASPTTSPTAPTSSSPAPTSSTPAPGSSSTTHATHPPTPTAPATINWSTSAGTADPTKHKTAAPLTPSLDPTTPAPIDLKLGAQAQAAKNRADHQVATLLEQIVAAAKSIRAAAASASLAEQRYAAQLGAEAQARAEARTAAEQLARAQAAYGRDQHNLAAAAAVAYETSTGPDALGVSMLGTLLIAEDPNAVLATDTEKRMLVARQATLTEQVKASLGALRAAQRDRAGAVTTVARDTARLASLRTEADAALAAAHRTVAVLTADLAKAKVSQKVADAALSSFLGGWSTADPKRADALDLAYAKLALKDKNDPPAPAAAHWTAAMGRTVVTRALQYLGTNYAWAGGSADGPTRGVCAAGDAHLDCRYIGFDCSGLALYGWAPYLSMAHFAATQYRSGALHPTPAELLPGDLVFWSSNGAPSGIHHVAIYVGDGNVIQAPQSGDIVRITPLGAVSSDYFGATRPLT